MPNLYIRDLAPELAEQIKDVIRKKRPDLVKPLVEDTDITIGTIYIDPNDFYIAKE